MSSNTANAILDVDHRAPSLNGWQPFSKPSLPLDYPDKNLYSYPETFILGRSNKPNIYHHYAPVKNPSTTPSLSSSLSSPSSASSGEDEDIPIPLTSRAPLCYPNSLIQKISLVDKLVGEHLCNRRDENSEAAVFHRI